MTDPLPRTIGAPGAAPRPRRRSSWLVPPTLLILLAIVIAASLAQRGTIGREAAALVINLVILVALLVTGQRALAGLATTESALRAALREAESAREVQAKAEREAAESRVLLQAVLERSPTGIFVKDAGGRYLLANPAFGDMIGREADTITGCTDDELFPSDVAAQSRATDAEIQETLQPSIHTMELTGPDGRRRSYMVAKDRVGRAGGTPITCGIATDITEHVALETALRESEALLRLTLDHAEVGLWDWRMDRETMAFDRTWNQILGYGPGEELPNQLESWNGTIHPEDAAGVQALLAQHLEDPRSLFEVVYRARHRSGDWIWIDARGRVVERDSTGTPRRMIGTIADITRLREGELHSARLAQVLENAGDAIVSKDLDGIVRTWNPAAERLFGFRPEEIIGQSITRIIPEERLGEETEILSRLRRGEVVLDFETVRQHKDGRQFPVVLSVSPIRDRRGTVIGINKVVRDIAALRAAQAMIESRNRDLEMLLHVASHDLREPLRSIACFSEMIRDRYAAVLDPKGVSYLTRVIAAVGRMNGLLNDVLQLSRARRADVQPDDLDPRALVEEVRLRLEDRIRETGARLIVSEDLPRLRADRAWATQALYNLVGNACKFRREGEPPEVSILPWVGPGETGVVVADRGPGVGEEHRERIFKLFQRAVGWDVEGSGAGLAIVRQVAERHGGRAWTQPREGGGAEFVITFATAGAA